VHHVVHHAVHHAVHHIPKCASLPRHCRIAPSRGGQVPYVDPGQTYKVQVKSSMKAAKGSSRFYSVVCVRAAVNPPRAQGTPPALALGATLTPLCRQVHLRRDKEQHPGHGRLRARGAEVAEQVPPTCASMASTRACPGPRCPAKAPPLAPHPPPPPCCLAPWTWYAARFEERINGEDELMKLVAEKKAAKAAAQAAGLKSR
jgi:hypothetical protein